MKDQFLQYLAHERHYSALTVLSYEQDLRAFEDFFTHIDSQLSWETTDSNIIRAWMESMMDKGHKATSINRRLSAVRSFYRFALSRGMVECDPSHGIAGPKRSKPLPKFVREQELNRLFDDVPWTDDFKDVRARTILLTLYSTGIRLAELIGLEDGSVDVRGRQMKVTGKRNKQRIVPFGDELAETLTHYLEIRGQQVPSRSAAFFTTKEGMPLTRWQVEYEVNKHLKRVSTQKHLTPHVLRHTFATSMVNHDAQIESVRRLLGHESMGTTEIYTHTTFEQLKKVYNQAHPRAN